MALAHSKDLIDTEFVRSRATGGSMWKSRSVTILVVLSITSSALSGLGGVNAYGASKTSNAKATVATGSVTCSKITGSINLSPPDQRGGTKPENMVWSINVSNCVTTGSNVVHVKGVRWTAAVHETTNACGALVYSKALHPSLKWNPKSVHPTVAAFSGFTFVRNKAGQEGFIMPNPGGSASIKGSFAGKDRGARSVVTLYTNLTARQFLAACDSKAGLAGYRIVSGTATFS